MPFRSKVLLLFPVMAVLLWIPCLAKDILDIADPALTTFNDRNGLPSNSVMTLTHDRRGYLWVGTQDGAAYFNGHTWTVINMPDRNISNYIFDLLPASDGSIWFATDGGGIHRLKEGEWQSFTSLHGLPGNSARVLLESPAPNGRYEIWAGMRDGLARFDGSKWSTVELGETPGLKRVRSLLATADDNGQTVIWAGTYGGLARLKGGQVRIYDTGTGLPHNTVFSLYEHTLENGDRQMMAGTEAGIAIILDNEAAAMENAIPELKSGIRLSLIHI
jgi:ligand-binding sensor domain-containing protein